jgi:hypothetical protein
METLCPFQSIYRKSEERLGADSARELVHCVSAICARSVTLGLYTYNPVDGEREHSGSGVLDHLLPPSSHLWTPFLISLIFRSLFGGPARDPCLAGCHWAPAISNQTVDLLKQALQNRRCHARSA